MNMGVSHRIGYVRAGYDADLVIWDNHPLSLGSTPLKVFVDGHITFVHGGYHKIMEKSIRTSKTEDHVDSMEAPVIPDLVCTYHRKDTTVLTNISAIYAGASSLLDKKDGALSVVIEKGLVKCFGLNCQQPTDSTVIDMNGAVITPGLILGM